MADVRALGVFQERVKTLLGSLVEVLLSEITVAYRESFPVNMSMNLCQKCFLNNPPESIRGDRDSGFRAESEQSQPLKILRCSDTVIPQQATSGGLKVMEAALNKSDSPNRLCPAPQEVRDINETTEDKYVTPLEEGKEQVEITHGVEHNADVKPMENEACEPAQSESSNQKLACDQRQKRASLDAGQSVSSMLREHTRPCSVQLDTIPIFERSGSKFYVCSFCSKIFMFAKTLKRHKRLHISERPNSCPHCLKSFNLRKTLLKHKKEHFKKLYSCTRCGKKYAHWRNLHLHWSCHAGRSPFLCFQCGKCCTTVLKRRRNLIKLTITD